MNDLKYIKLFEDIDWEFYEDETPINIYDINNYKISELYKMFNNINELINWLDVNLKGKTISVFNNSNDIVLKNKIFREINLERGMNDKKISIHIEDNFEDVPIFILDSSFSVFLSDTIKIIKI